MTWIFMGFSFLLLDCSISIGNTVISLTPDFIGYFALFLGIRKLWRNAPRINTLRIFCAGMILVSATEFVAYLFGMTAHMTFILMILLLPKVLIIFFTLRLAEQTEEQLNITLSAKAMIHLLYGYTGCYLSMLILMICPVISAAAFIMQLFTIGVALMILFTLYNSIKTFRAFCKDPANEAKLRAKNDTLSS